MRVYWGRWSSRYSRHVSGRSHNAFRTLTWLSGLSANSLRLPITALVVVSCCYPCEKGDGANPVNSHCGGRCGKIPTTDVLYMHPWDALSGYLCVKSLSAAAAEATMTAAARRLLRLVTINSILVSHFVVAVLAASPEACRPVSSTRQDKAAARPGSRRRILRLESGATDFD